MDWQAPRSKQQTKQIALRLGCKCNECPFNKPTSNVVLGEGPLPSEARGILIGEGPGDRENEVGKPFVGPTGEKLDWALTREGISRGRLFILNATGCKPPGGTGEREMGVAVKCCRPLFERQMKAYAHVPALVMGRWAWQQFLGKKPPKGLVDKGRGFVRPSPWKDGVNYVATWHPTFAFFRNPWVLGAFLVDVSRFGRMEQGKLRPGPHKLTAHATRKDLERLVRRGLPLAADIETAPSDSRSWTALNPYKARIRCLGFGNIEEGISFDWREVQHGKSKEYVRWVLRSNCITFHNGIWFDIPALRKNGFAAGKVFDTRDARRALSATSQLSLGHCSTLYDDPGPWKQDQDSDDTKGLVFTSSLEENELYNAEDCVRTARVKEGEEKEEEWNTPRVQRIYEVSLELSRAAADMYRFGIGVNRNRRRVLSQRLGEEHARRVARFQELTGVAGFKPTPNNMRALIYASCAREGLPCFNVENPILPNRYTEKGLIKVDQQSMLALITDPYCDPRLVQVVDAYWQAESVRQAKAMYVDSEMVSQALWEDDRLRPSWNSCGTDTYRFACSDPNVMNIPEEKKE